MSKKRAYIFQPDKLDLDRTAGQTFWEIDKFPVWDLGDGFYQIICEPEKLPDWAKSAVDIRNVDKDAAKRAPLSGKYQPTCAAIAADPGKGIPAKEERKIPLPRVILLGQVPEDLVADEEPDPKLGEEEVKPK